MNQFIARIFAVAALVLFGGANGIAALTTAQKNAVAINVTQTTGPEYAITVDLAKQRYRFVTTVANYENPESLAKQKALMGWVGDYLFVRHQCSGSYEWRCVVDQIFTVDVTTTSAKLMYIGATESAACTTLGCGYNANTGLFTDVYDGLQNNPVTGQVDAPPLRIARRITNNKLQSDLSATWEINTTNYQAAITCLQHVKANGFAVPCADKLTPWTSIVSAAKLTHYVGKTAERTVLFDDLGKAYCEKSADARCGFRVAGAKDHFSRFAMGDDPQYLPSRVENIDLSAAAPADAAIQPMKKGKTIQLK